MGTALGKRKSRRPDQDAGASPEDAQAIFRRHFEAQFKPLPQPAATTPTIVDMVDTDEDEMESEISESEWGGLSDDDHPPLEIIDHSTHPPSPEPTMTKHELRTYMSSRPPNPTTPTTTTPPPHPPRLPSPPKDESAPSLLASDLALHRLLTESHLLHPSSAPRTASTTARRTADQRLRALGARASLYDQPRMPMATRRGIAAAAAAREAVRRREARKANVVLERPVADQRKGRGGGGGGARRRERDVNAPAVGRMRAGGAELRISKRDVREIEGPRKTAERGRKKKRR